MATRIIPILCLAILAGCSQSFPSASTSGEQSPSPTAIPVSVPSATPVASSSSTPTPQTERDYFQEAIAKADRAARMAQNATSNDDWTLVVNLYQQTIDLLKQVPQNNANYAEAQEKLKEYQTNLASAQTKRDRPTNIVATTPRPSPQSAQPARSTSQASAAMTAQEFLESIYFHRVINQGYSGGTLWCASSEILETSFFSPRSYEILNITEHGQGASATVRIESSNRGGQPIINNWSFYLKKEQTTTERNYLQQNSPVTAQAWRNSIGGWCVAMINES